jgi:membrane protease subunit HflK
MIKFPGWRAQNNDGPPDLDQVLRDVSRKINTLFGGGNNGYQPNQPNNNQLNITIPVLPIIGLVALIWFSTGFYKVDSGSLGVVQRFGKMADDTTEPGLHWHLPYPIETVNVVNMDEVRRLEVGYRTSGDGGTGKIKQPQEALMLTEDENIIELQFAVQYNLNNAKHYLFNNELTDDAVKSAAESAIREVVGKNKLDNLLQKGLVDTSARMQEILDRYQSGVHIISVSLQSALPPEPVQEAFEDVNRANQDNQRQVNEGQAYAKDVIPKSRGQAARLMAEAAGYKLKMENQARGNASRFDQILAQYNNAPEVTRQRLYLDAQEQILSTVSKVVVDQKAGTMLYLPIDKMMNNTAAAPTPAPVQTTPAATLPAPAATQDTLERARDALRNRDNR